MIISYHGEGCLRLQSGSTSLLVDPSSGRLKGDVIVRTRMSIGETPFFSKEEVSYPGEYELSGIMIEGHELEAKKGEVRTAYIISWEGFRMVVLGLGATVPGADFWDHAGEVDVLVLPAGSGEDLISQKDAIKLVRQIEPAAVVVYPEKHGRAFAKEMEQNVSPEEKFTFKSRDLEPGAARVVVLKGN